ncbi:MAG: hypothetical protein OEY52_06510 [Gammaproteobacteria bacterium]|nr:hypothetical protein [Gammaproteobacteria bacterium]
MRNLIFLIVISAFMIWFGINFKQTTPRAARLSLIGGGILALFILIGFFRLV